MHNNEFTAGAITTCLAKQEGLPAINVYKQGKLSRVRWTLTLRALAEADISI